MRVPDRPASPCGHPRRGNGFYSRVSRPPTRCLSPAARTRPPVPPASARSFLSPSQTTAAPPPRGFALRERAGPGAALRRPGVPPRRPGPLGHPGNSAWTQHQLGTCVSQGPLAAVAAVGRHTDARDGCHCRGHTGREEAAGVLATCPRRRSEIEREGGQTQGPRNDPSVARGAGGFRGRPALGESPFHVLATVAPTALTSAMAPES